MNEELKIFLIWLIFPSILITIIIICMLLNLYKKRRKNNE